MATKTAAERQAAKDAAKMAQNAANAAATETTIQSYNKSTSAFDKMLAAVPTSGKVTVGCKLPNGLKMRTFRFIEIPEPVQGGGMRFVKQAQATGEEVKLAGFAVPFGKRPKFDIIGDFALTKNVDAKFFRTWLEQNKDLDLVKNGLIFCHKDHHSAQDHAEEHAELMSGLEPLVPDTDVRIPKARNKNLEDVKTADVAA